MDEDGRDTLRREELIDELKEVGLDVFRRRHCGKTEQGDLALLQVLRDKGGSLQHTPSTVICELNKQLLKILRYRKPIPLPSTIEAAANVISEAQNILVLTGAGISTSCGIPDFRSSSGLFAQLKQEAEVALSASSTFNASEKPASSTSSKRPIRSAALDGERKRKRFDELSACDLGTEGTSYGWIYDLVDPQEITDIKVFRERPEIFYSFAEKLYPVPGRLPSASHRFIKALEDRGKLLRNYSQNIDTLESVAGIKNVIACHGSFATASCCRCGLQVPGKQIESAILERTVPMCKKCKPSKISPRPVMKPDITFFNERITSTYDGLLTEDRKKVDLLIVMGTSLPVPPINDLPFLIPHRVPQILINRGQPRGLQPDIWLQGDCDNIVMAIQTQLSW